MFKIWFDNYFVFTKITKFHLYGEIVKKKGKYQPVKLWCPVSNPAHKGISDKISGNYYLCKIDG